MSCEDERRPHRPTGPEASPRSERLLGPAPPPDAPPFAPPFAPFAPDADADVIAATRAVCSAASRALHACFARAVRRVSARPDTATNDEQKD